MNSGKRKNRRKKKRKRVYDQKLDTSVSCEEDEESILEDSLESLKLDTDVDENGEIMNVSFKVSRINPSSRSVPECLMWEDMTVCVHNCYMRRFVSGGSYVLEGEREGCKCDFPVSIRYVELEYLTIESPINRRVSLFGQFIAVSSSLGFKEGDIVSLRNIPKSSVSNLETLQLRCSEYDLNLNSWVDLSNSERIELLECFIHRIINGSVVSLSDLCFSFSFASKLYKIQSAPNSSPGYGRVVDGTKVSVITEGNEDTVVNLPKLAGVSDISSRIFRLINHVASGLRFPPKGVLLYGPSGTGKSALAQSILCQCAGKCTEHLLNHNILHVPEVISPYVGESEEAIFHALNSSIPCSIVDGKFPVRVIILDEIDAVSSRSGELEYSSRRLLSSLTSWMDTNSRVFFIGTTSRLEQVENSLRRPGRFDYEFEIGMPSESQRKEIWNTITGKCNVESEYVVSHTHGFTGADLALLWRESALSAVKNCRSSVEMVDLMSALNAVRPSGLREILIEVPEVHWCDVGGQENVKQLLRECVEWPLIHREKFALFNISGPKGVLMYGPPGCSKTLLAKAMATESAMNFIAVKGPELLNKYVGESEKAIREVFRKARLSAPTIIFFDEIDAIGSHRHLSSSGSSVSARVLSQLLYEMDGLVDRGEVVVVGATNRPDFLDKALLRPGRFDRLICVSLPDLDARVEIFRIHLRGVQLASDVEISRLAEMTDGYSGAEIRAVCREAAMQAIEANINAESVCESDFLRSLEVVRPRITASTIKFYEKFAKNS